MKVEDIAQVCHEANRAIQRINGEVVNFPWENTTEVLRNSAIDGVRGVIAGNSPEESHANWSAYKRREGWVFGATKDFGAKTHPDLVEYDDLPESQKLKDILFCAVVAALA